ncbi:twin-arginine translocation signal domain-containing protein [Gemmatimonas sp.]|uniref:twin-arginine translocation signal domain-containing protein n=1 Tax=Gemmatimonas sp. TaxID=1962908 RepID=UPI0039838870
MTSRRDFVKQGGAALGALLLAGSSLAAIPRLLGASPAPDPRAGRWYLGICRHAGAYQRWRGVGWDVEGCVCAGPVR